MGEVYRAHDARLNRDVAVKVLPQEFLTDPDRLRRFEQEARAAAALNHPNILAVHDIGSHDGVPYFVCELLAGETLRAQLDRGPLPVEQVAGYGAQIARGLAAAHDRGIVHRDVKPENLFLTTDGRLKILDFGIAKATPPEGAGRSAPTVTSARLTEPGLVLGTMPYMSPEQVRGAPTDGRSDIFAVGAVLFEMLTGRRAFQASSANETMSAVLTRDPFAQDDVAPARWPPALVQIVKHCLEKDPKQRFQSASDIAFGLEVFSGTSATAAVKAPGTGAARVRQWIPAAAGALLVVALAIALWRWTIPSGAGTSGATVASIAALPLTNLSGNPQDEYFTDGMTDSLITELARTPNLSVIARAAVFRYKDKTADPQKVGQELGARYVLHGSVQRAADRVRVNVRLVDVVTGYDVLGEPFEEDVKDLFVLQNKISGRIAGALRLKLGAPGDRRREHRPTTNEHAYDAYLQGMYYLHRSDGAKGASVDRAIVFFEQAVNADPQFALAQAALGSAYSYRFFYLDADRQWEQKAFLAIEKALALDPDLAEAYLARGQLAWTLPNNFPHEKAVRDLQHAIAINPSLADAHRELGKIYLHIGLLEKSIDANAQALRLDPGDGTASGRRVLAHIYLRQCAVALQLLDQGSIEGPGRFRTRALALICLGRNDEALVAISSASPKNETDQSLNALLLARTGKHDAARKQIEQARLEVGNVQELSDRHHAQYYIAAAHAVIGDTRQAVSWLKKASREGLPCYPLFERDPDLDSLRQDPEFAAFMAQLKAQVERFRATL